MRDKVFGLLFIIALIGMVTLVLSGFYDVESLMLFSLIIAGIVVVKHRSPRRKELSYLLLMAIPIAMKIAFYYFYVSADITAVITNSLITLYDILNVVGLSVLVALGEESFRAIVYETVKAIEGDTANELVDKSALLVSNIAWIILHFVRRKELISLYPYETVYYVIWLFITGAILTIIYTFNSLIWESISESPP